VEFRLSKEIREVVRIEGVGVRGWAALPAMACNIGVVTPISSWNQAEQGLYGSCRPGRTLALLSTIPALGRRSESNIASGSGMC
jgi:hypothetical protein